MWRRALIGVLSTAAVTCVAMALHVAEPRSRGPLHVAPERVDLGSLDQGQEYAGEFTLRNTSARVVRVTEIYGSCSCTAHELSDAELAPEEAARLTLTYDSGVSRGNVSTDATLYYVVEGEKQLRFVNCVLTGHVEPKIAFSPERLQFEQGSDANGVVVLRPHRIEAFHVTALGATHSAFSAAMNHDRDPRSECPIRVTFDAGAWGARDGEAELVIRTDDAVAPLLRIPILVTPPRNE